MSNPTKIEFVEAGPSMIEQLKAAYAFATPGEWSMNDGLIYGIEEGDDDSVLVCDVVGHPTNAISEQDDNNGKFIVLAKKNMADLLNAVEMLSLVTAALDNAVLAGKAGLQMSPGDIHGRSKLVAEAEALVAKLTFEDEGDGDVSGQSNSQELQR